MEKTKITVAGKFKSAMGLQKSPANAKRKPDASPNPTRLSKSSSQKVPGSDFSRTFTAYFPRASAQVQPRQKQRLISVMDPTRTWAARWLRIGIFIPDCYTLTVSEAPPDEFQVMSSSATSCLCVFLNRLVQDPDLESSDGDGFESSFHGTELGEGAEGIEE